MIGWITNTTTSTNFFMEIFGPVIDWIIAIGIIMIFTFAFLIIKAIYKIFFKGIYIRLKYRDADIATEMSFYVRNKLLLDVGNAMFAQANIINQNVLALLA